MIRILLLALSILCLQSCKENGLSVLSKNTRIGGKIISPQDGAIIDVMPDGPKNIAIKADGSFIIDPKLKSPSILMINYGQIQVPVYAKPGDAVNVQIDTRSYNGTPVFTGDNALENTFLSALALHKEEKMAIDFQKIFSSNESDFVHQVEERRNQYNTFLQEYQQKNGTFSQDFAEVIQAELDYESASLKLNYPEYYSYFVKDSVLRLSETYESFFQNLSIDDESKMGLPTYRQFIKEYTYFQAGKDAAKDSVSIQSIGYNLVPKHFQSSSIRSHLYYEIMKDLIDFEVNAATPLIEKYKADQTNPTYLKEVIANYEQWKPLLKGSEAPDFNYEDSKGKTVSLSALKGKIVYIDIWATWCGPCLAELPYLEKLQEELKQEKDMVFVSVSIDKDKDAWKKMINDKKMKGTQLFADQDWQSKIVSDYMIKGIPRFIIIGKDGKIIDANAVRPSNDQILNKLIKALG